MLSAKTENLSTILLRPLNWHNTTGLKVQSRKLKKPRINDCVSVGSASEISHFNYL